MIEPIEFKNPAMKGILDSFVDRFSRKEKIFIRHEDIELLPLILRTTDPHEFQNLQKQDQNFFYRLLNYLKLRLEAKTGKTLFLTLREGNYVILDSWHANYQDWKIEGKHRSPDFLFMRDRFFEAKEKIPSIKSLEDFFVVLEHLKLCEIKELFRKEDAQILKDMIKKIKDL
ncbi:MAG: hypothetical protein IEMM0008_0941 [bacterium]|nr:MAG: hypothetical protein IEMM0008_0941 [bacterium]